MHESARTFHNLEIPAPDATLAPGWQRIRGWALPKAGGHFVDVRVWVQGLCFPAVHGFPRTDLATFFQLRLPYALAEFTATVEVAPGTTAEIVYEALDLEGQWREFARATHRVDAALPRSDVPAPGGSFRWHDFCRGLEVVLRSRRAQPTASWSDLATRFAAAVPYPRDLRSPELPFIGFLDEPAAANRCRFGRVPVIGHVFHTTSAIKAVYASADLQVLQPLESNHPLPHVGAFYTQYPTAATSGYLGFVDVPSQLPGPTAVRIYAELVDGTLHLVHALRTRLYDADDEKFACAPHDAGDFETALSAWRQALQARGIPLIEDGDFLPAVGRVRDSYQQYVSRLTPGGEVPPLVSAPAAATAPAPKTILLVTHNLNAEGAPLFLVDLAGEHVRAGSAVTVLSPADGPLRARFEATGAKIALVDASAVFAAADATAAQAGLKALAAAFDFRAFDVVVCNTFTTFWAVHAAKAAGRRVLLYIHESTTPAGFYRERFSLAVIALAEEALRVADAVSFTTQATRRYHLDYSRPASQRLSPGWIDVAALDRWRAQNPRDALRAKFSLQPGELLVTNIGTVCERKGQHIFARAVDLLWRRHPELAARTRFVMLGGGDSTFDASLNELVSALGRTNLVVHPATLDYLPYYVAADLFVCSTYEESSPRVILEAMACGTPILSSNVHGIPEQVRDGHEACLIPAGDTSALADALADLLSQPERNAALAQLARARVVAEFDAKILLPRHLALAAAVAAGQS